MRSNTRKNQVIEKMAEMFGKEMLTNQITNQLKQKAGLLTLGLTLRQWTAMWLICLIVLPIVSAPVSAAAVWNQPVSNEYSHFEPVNPPQPVWKEAKLKFDLAMERWLASPKLPEAYLNNNKAPETADDKNKSEKGKLSPKEILEKRVKTVDTQIENETRIKVGQIISLAAVSRDDKGNIIEAVAPQWTSLNPGILKIDNNAQALALKNGEARLLVKAGNIEKEIRIEVEINREELQKNSFKNASAKPSLKASGKTSLLMNQPADRPILSDTQLSSLTSPQNNLGSPLGQTEASAPNQAVAGAAKERAGIGNFSFGLPVASLPGRGINASVGITYNSQLWTKSGSQFTYNVDGNWLAPGFQMSQGYLDAYGTVNQPPSIFVLTGADGTRYQLDYISNNYGIYLYESADGSFVKAEFQYCSACTVQYQRLFNLRVTYSDGTQIWYTAPNSQNRHFPTKIRDVQGNYINISYMPNDEVGQIHKITDTLGREIIFHYDSSPERKLILVTTPGYNNSPAPYVAARFYYDTIQLQTDGRFSGTIVAPETITVLKYIMFPGTKTGYRYDYSASYGMIYKITELQGMTLTTGGTVDETSYLESAWTRYHYPGTDIAPPASALADVPKYDKRTDDWLGRDTSATAPQTLFNLTEQITNGVGTRTTVITSPDNTKTTSILNVKSGQWDDGLLKETFVTTTGRALPWAKTILEWDDGPITRGRKNPRVIKTEVSNEAGQARATTFGYDDYNNQTLIKEHDFAASGSTGTELRRTEISYETRSNWIQNHLLRLPTSVKTTVNNTIVSRTDYEYDTQALADASGVVQHEAAYNPHNDGSYACNCRFECQAELDPVYSRCTEPEVWVCDTCYVYNPATNYRGNVTKVKSFVDPYNNNDPKASVNEIKYDITGNIVEATLNCCNVKTWEYSADNQYAYPTKEIKGSSAQLTTQTAYDPNTGLVETTTDENNQVTDYQYESDTLRQKKVVYPNGGSVTTEYSDKLITTATQLVPGYVKTTTTLDTNKTVQSYTYFDGRGASIRTATETQADGWSISAVEYDSIGRAVKTYNPFYAAGRTDAPAAGVKWTEAVNFDGLGRTTKVKMQDGSFVETFINEAAVSYTDADSLARTGTASRVKDQADKERRQIVDALGRVIRVDEPDKVTGSLGGDTAPNQPTHYYYDGNDNLSKVIQIEGSTRQERLFKYDALSQLTHERQVEATATLNDTGGAGNQWTKVLKYDSFGRLTEGVDARGVKTEFKEYDGLNRIKRIEFSDDTPMIKYYYDQARTGFFNKGALTRVETVPNAVNPRPDTPDTATEFDYDLMGRVKKHRQSIGTQTYNLEYVYNLAGQLTKEIYPSGREVSVGYDTKGRLSTIADGSRTYLNGLVYQGKDNSLSSMTFGNGTTQTFTLNDRLQMINQTLAKGSDVIQKYDYNYGQLDTSGNLIANSNNGQLATVESHIGANKQWTKKYSYDSIGRLSKEEEYRGDNSALVYRNQYDYDRFGNLFRKQASNPNSLSTSWIEDSHISKTTNRFSSSTQYDNAGNVTQDTKFRSLNYWYDANGRMYKTSSTLNPTNEANSVYDASGQRVATEVDDVWQFFIYDAFGKKVAEYGGLSAMDEGGVKYVLSDWQGSTRAITNNTGVVQARMDYTAFGEEILVNVGQRTVAQGFNSNQTLRNKYALTERDQATGLDHTWFRKNENKAGRWTSPDPYNGSMSLGNPQSFNRYSYVENQPTNFVDPTGLNASSGGGSCWVSWTATGWYIGDVLVGITNFNMNVSCSGGSANAQTGGLPNRATINTILDQKGDNQKDTCREFLNKAFEALKKGRNIDNVYANIKDIYIDSRLGIRNPKTNEVVNGQARFDKNGNRTIALAPYRGTGGQDASDGFYARNIFHELMHHAANSGTFTHDQMANAVTQATGIKKPDGIKSTTFVSQQINAHCPNAVSTKPK